MTYQEILSWLLSGDASIQYQTYRDLLDVEKPKLRAKIELEGWGKQFLSYRKNNSHWGNGFYDPKWTCSHYTLLDLKNLAISPGNKLIKKTIDAIFEKEKGADGGINPAGTAQGSDVCINGMAINYACYFQTAEKQLKSVVDFVLHEKMDDGGFNCHSNRKGAVHSSLHTTLSVLEGIDEYEKNGYQYRLKELRQAKKTSQEFILMHSLYKSDKTGETIKPSFLTIHYPCRWNYDILKAMDYFQAANAKYDARMQDAIEAILGKRTKEGQWKLPSHHKGKIHFEMEEVGKPSRWNTLRSLRVMKKYNEKLYAGWSAAGALPTSASGLKSPAASVSMEP